MVWWRCWRWANVCKPHRRSQMDGFWGGTECLHFRWPTKWIWTVGCMGFQRTSNSVSTQFPPNWQKLQLRHFSVERGFESTQLSRWCFCPPTLRGRRWLSRSTGVGQSILRQWGCSLQSWSANLLTRRFSSALPLPSLRLADYQFQFLCLFRSSSECIRTTSVRLTLTFSFPNRWPILAQPEWNICHRSKPMLISVKRQQCRPTQWRRKWKRVVHHMGRDTNFDVHQCVATHTHRFLSHSSVLWVYSVNSPFPSIPKICD